MEREGRGDRSKIHNLEEELRQQITNLKSQIESTGSKGYSSTSVGHNKTVEEYKRDRELLLKKLTQVPGPRPVCIDWKVHEEELEASQKPEYTTENLPFLLHEFFTGRLSYLVHLKHSLLVRWARFSSQPSVVATLYDDFQELMSSITLEYNDALTRCRRLSETVDCLLAEKPCPRSAVDREDIYIHLRWLVSHLHCTKKLSATAELIKWIPHLHFEQFLSETDGHKETSKNTQQSSQATAGFTSVHGVKGHKHLSAVGGGLRVRSDSLFVLGRVAHTIPQHTVDMAQLQPLFNQLLSCYGLTASRGIHGSGEELELYYQVKQKFHTVFKHQERLTTYHTYGTNVEDLELTGNNLRDSFSAKIFKKVANWTEFNTFRSGKHPLHVKAMSRMKERAKDQDVLLDLQSKCLQMSSENRTLYALKQHVVMAMHPEPVTPVSVQSHKSKRETLLIWRGIYQGLDARNPLDPLPDEDKPSDNTLDTNWDGTFKESSSIFMTSVPGQDQSNASAAVNVPTVSHETMLTFRQARTAPRRVNTPITIPSALQLMSTEEGRKVSTKALSAPKNAFFAFVLTRHIRIRDLSRKCLSVLNYFRSIERTLVINCGGLSLDAEGKSHDSTYHSYAHLYETPADYRVKETDFIRFKSIENHDDYYSSEDGLHKVLDVKGAWIMYDVSLEDYKLLEEELLCMASYYLQKSHSSTDRGSDDIDVFSHRKVDRFAVLLDLWTCEEQYQQDKKKVVDCYLEAYHLTPDPVERRNLAQVIYDIINTRPRYDLEAPYFTDCYHDEIDILRLHFDLMSSVMANHISDYRDYNQLLGGRRRDKVFGLPLPLVAKQHVALAGDKSAACPIYLLEVCPSISLIGTLYHSLKDAVEETVHLCSLSPTAAKTNVLSIELTLLQLAMEEIGHFTHLGVSYTSEVQKKVFSEAFIEHPCFVADLCKRSAQEESSEEELTPSERQGRMLESGCNCLELILLRHRLLLAAQKTEFLSKVYKSQLLCFKEDTYHAHLRLVPFDHSAKLTIPKDVTKVMELALSDKQDEASLDRFTPSESCLTIEEVSLNMTTTTNFQTSGDVMGILTPRGMNNLRVTLTAQVSMSQCLSMAVQYHSAVRAVVNDRGTPNGTDTRTSQLPNSKAAYQQLSSSSTRSLKREGTKPPQPNWKKDVMKSFVSLQRCKVPLRDFMLEQYTEKPLSSVRGQEDAERTQRELIVAYCHNLLSVFSHFSLKTQLMHTYSKFSSLLKGYPAIRDVYFHFGKPKELHRSAASLTDETHKPSSSGLISDPRQSRSRPLSLISSDGNQITNMWYIPHITEITKLCFEVAPLSKARDALTMLARMSANLLQIIMTFCANAQLGSRKGFHGNKPGAEWGGLEGVGNELSNLSNELSRLERPNDLAKVLEYLEGKSKLQYWCHYIVTGWSLPQTFLSKHNLAACSILRHHSAAFLEKMSDTPSRHRFIPGFCVPETVAVLCDTNKMAARWFPWQWFLHHSHTVDPDLKWKSYSAERDTHAMLALLPQKDRCVAQGELIGISAQIEEILLRYYQQQKLLPGNNKDSSSQAHEQDKCSSILSVSGAISRGLKLPNYVSPGSSLRKSPQTSGPLNLLSSVGVMSTSSLQGSTHSQVKSGWLLLQPLVAMEYALKYLTMASILEVTKWVWSARVLGKSLPTGYTKDYNELQSIQKMYKECVLEPVQKHIVKYVVEDGVSGTLTADMDSSSVGFMDSEELQYSELQLLKAQYSHLVKLLEAQLISEQVKHMVRLQNLVTLESEQEENVLPISAWKKPSFKEPPVILKGNCPEVFVRQFGHVVRTEGNHYIISKRDWKNLMVTLETSILNREKEVYEIYSTFYEGMLNHLYVSQYHREQELEHYKEAAAAKVFQSRNEAIVLLAEQTEDLILEITALRTKVSELEEELDHSKAKVTLQVQQDYRDLVSDVFSFSSAVKTRFEDYRQELYGDTLQALQDVRHQASENVKRMRQRLGLTAEEDDNRGGSVFWALKGEDTTLIQRENSSLANNICKMKVLNNWHQLQQDTAHHFTVKDMEESVNDLRVELTQQKTQSQEEILLLRQQVETLRKGLFKSEKEVDSLKKELSDQKQKRIEKSKSFAKTQESALVKADSVSENKIEQLMLDLEKKDQRIRELTEQQEKQFKSSESEQSKIKRALKDVRKQLSQERHLKIDAFHQFEDLVTKVHEGGRQSPRETTRSYGSHSPVLARQKTSHTTLRKHMLKTHSHSDIKEQHKHD